MDAGTSSVGWPAHREAVDRLQASYRAISSEAPVRLAKRSSNLFRTRSVPEHPGLDVSRLDAVIAVDPATRTAEVQGMCTYEDLVAATLRVGLLPLVVPQLRTITLGGAVSGLGVESTSFRSGLPHESVTEMEVLTGAGEVLLTRPGDPLFDAFPNSYGSLGYATRLRIDLEPAAPAVRLRHVRFTAVDDLSRAVETIVRDGSWEGEPVDGLDGVAFAPDELVLTLARGAPAPGAGETPSDYGGQQIYYRSLRERDHDLLETADYLWRWDTDWFWCSSAFGAQHPLVRRCWPRRWRRSDVYHRLVGLDRRFDVADRLDRLAGRPRRERVIQDVELPLERLGDFLTWFDAEVGMRPVWLCPLVARRDWPTYPLEPGRVYVNVGFWGTVHVGPEAPQAPLNRAIEERLHELGGHKSLYSEAYYDRETFDRLYGGARLADVKATYDPQQRLPTLYDKAVRQR